MQGLGPGVCAPPNVTHEDGLYLSTESSQNETKAHQQTSAANDHSRSKHRFQNLHWWAHSVDENKRNGTDKRKLHLAD